MNSIRAYFPVAMLLAASVLLSGCAGLNKSVLTGGSSITASIDNPATKRELAVVEASYGVAVSLAVNYRRLGICKRDQEPTFSAPCAKRSVVLVLQDYDRRAHAAVLAARAFVRNNPRLSAVSVLSAARNAVNDYRNAIPTKT